MKLKLSIDRNKIMHWFYRVGNGDFVAANPVDDPWSPRQMNPADQRLASLRRQMQEGLLNEPQIPDWLLLEEANLVRMAGQLEEAQLALLDFVAHRGLNMRAANLLGLICGQQGNLNANLNYSEKAATLAPENPIMVGNHGCTLIKSGKRDAGIARSRSALSLDPNLAYLYEWLGDTYRDMGDEPTALREYRQGIMLLELVPEAALNWLARHLDLVQRLQPGQRIEIPALQLNQFVLEGPPDPSKQLVEIQVLVPG